MIHNKTALFLNFCVPHLFYKLFGLVSNLLSKLVSYFVSLQGSTQLVLLGLSLRYAEAVIVECRTLMENMFSHGKALKSMSVPPQKRL